ncbi:MAG: hypothetical protein E7270_01530 [Lachnospiraceae bacterium]|nr:hypothetical protein [Lachnospiraceae bacterium]
MYENTIVDSVYGCLPGSIWGGCRIIKPNKYCDAQTTDIYDLRDNYYDLGVNLRHTYTNCELPQEAYYDFKNLQWTAACEHDGNSIIITDPKLKEFLHERFPKYNFIWSTSLCLHDINEIN